MVSVSVVVVDPAFEADASSGFGSEPVVVEELVGEGATGGEAVSFHRLRFSGASRFRSE